MNASLSPKTVYLKDYQPPAFQVATIDLTIAVFAHETIVTSTLMMQRSSAGICQLWGVDLELLSLEIDGQLQMADAYQVEGHQLILAAVPDQFRLTTCVRIQPFTNTHLEGLYASGDMLCTQNEPEGFRRITFFPDRPDVLSVFTTRIEADITYPTLLANGNLIERGQLAGGRHFCVWHDPTKKPCYLFACVVADLAVLQDNFVTMEGRDVALEIYAKATDLPKCQVAMQALKDAMLWDEKHYGRAYDLDNYMIVAVSHFNMGAMENKGLNIFNTSCVLADPQTTTDLSMFHVKAVIAHEYFHNWTGNRITCRDWFQLCLKEGFTVFRDQSFSEDIQSRAVQRIDDVSQLKSVQFSEDAGPLSHPPRPDHFVEINNFYTATVYDKGAEIARMMATLLGSQRFRAGTDHYFHRFDGQAVTVEDLIDALAEGSNIDLSDFLRWYSQPGTPRLRAKGAFDAANQRYELVLSQHLPEHPQYQALQPVPIPVALAFFDRATGVQMPTVLANALHPLERADMVMLTTAQQTFIFEGVTSPPLLSLLRNFSAPVLVEMAQSQQDIAQLMRFESDGFNQWQAAQQLYDGILLEGQDDHALLEVLSELIPKLGEQDPLLAAKLLEVPTEQYLAGRINQNYHPHDVRARREVLYGKMADHFAAWLSPSYAALPLVAYEDNAHAMGQRAYRNMLLALMCRVSDPVLKAQGLHAAQQQFKAAVCMSERLFALRQLVHHQVVDVSTYLSSFYTQFKAEALAIDLWFGVQAGSIHSDASTIAQLVQHTNFDINTPNRVRAVYAYFSGNAVNFWQADGVRCLIALVRDLDGRNPILGSRMLGLLTRWYTLADTVREPIYAQLEALKGQFASGHLQETLNHLLQAKDKVAA